MSEKDCIFCKVINEELPSRKVYESDQVIAFHDINSEAPVHVLVVPRKHIISVNDLEEKDKDLLAEMFSAVRKITTDLGVAEGGYRLIINTGKDGGQLIKHLHMHLLGGKALGPKLIK